MTPINNSPVCKCAVPMYAEPHLDGWCMKCDALLPKEVKCCGECFLPERDGATFYSHAAGYALPEGCKDKDCPCHSPNTEASGRVVGKCLSPQCSHNLHGRDINLPCSIRALSVHKCCEHCEENGHAPHSEGCPDWEAQFDEAFPITRKKIGIQWRNSRYISPTEVKDFIRKTIESEKNKAREALKNHLQNIINEFGGNAEQCLAILEEILAGKTDVEL